MKFELDDRFLRDLNPDLHFKATSEGYRVSSAAFKDTKVAPGVYACSVDAERLAGTEAEEFRIRRGHKEWGVGRVTLGEVRESGKGDVVPDPKDDNPAHCNLTVRERKAGKLAMACEVVIEPTDTKWIADYRGNP